jgi:hypothetical protein
MKVFFGFRFAIRLAAFCLLAGFALGFHFGAAAASHSAPDSGGAEVLDFRPPQPAGPCTGEEVPLWSHTPTSLSWCSTGS